MIVDASQFLLHEGKNLPIVLYAPKQRLAPMPNESDLLAWMRFQILLDLKNDLLGKRKAKYLLVGFGFVAQIAVFATEITGVGGLKNDDHYKSSSFE